jgi:DNA repair protein RadD
MTMELRQYQRAAVDSVREYWNGGGGNPLVEMATGTGKSVVIATLAQEVLTDYPDMRILMLVHVRELVEQNAMALLRQWPQAPLGINSAGLNKRDRHSRVLFASIQSVYKNGYDLGPRDLVLIDECHLVPKSGQGMYRTLLDTLREMVPDLRAAGFTATGFRLDSGRLDEGEGDERLFHDVVYTYNLADGVRDGYLSPLIARGTGIEIDVRGVARRGGEFVAGALEAAADKVDVVQGAADEMLRLGSERKSWLAFCSGVDHAAHVRDALRERGISAETVTGETPNGERDRIIRGFRSGQIRCLTNAMVLTTGFDVPRVDLIAMLRPTLSTGLYVQTLGRGTRLFDGKSDCLVLDFAGNVRRHGPVDAVSVKQTSGTKEEREALAVKPETVRAKICPNCHTYNALDVFVCVCCAHEWPLPTPKHAATADVLPIMTRDLPKWIPVRDVLLEKHQKLDSPNSLRVEYVCGLQTVREWICLEHTGTAQWKAAAWWKAMGGLMPVPKTVDEAMNRGQELDLAEFVTIAKEGKFNRIVSRRARRPNGALVEVDDRFRCKLVDETAEAAA